MSNNAKKPNRNQKPKKKATGSSDVEVAKPSQVTGIPTPPAEPVITSHGGVQEKLTSPCAAGDASATITALEDQPPSTNRGVTITIHWLSLTFFINPAKAMTHFLNQFLGYKIENEMDWSDDFTALHHGARGYEAMYIGPSGVRFYAYPSTGKHCHLEIPGEVLEQYGMDITLAYLSSLMEQDYRWHATRIDVAFDHTLFTPRQCYDAWLNRNVRSYAQYNFHDWRENAEGQTLTIGSRKSGRFIRIYNRRGFTRLEIEFKQDWAKPIGLIIATSESSEWTGKCFECLRDFVDFVDTQNGTINVSRAPMLPWWSEFIQDAERAKINREIKKESNLVAKTKRYLERMLPTLYVMRHGLGISLDERIETVESSLSNRHRNKLARLRELLSTVK